MSDLQESTAPWMARLKLYFFTVLTLFVATFTFNVSVAADSGVAIPIFIFSTVLIVLIFSLILFRRSSITQRIAEFFLLLGGIFLGYQTPIAEVLTQPVFLLVVLPIALAVISRFFYVTFRRERKTAGPPRQQYRKHSGEKGFRIDTEA